MTLEDPFHVVKDEVFRALNKTRGLYIRWQELTRPHSTTSAQEVEWTAAELRNALRSIDWDLEDLEDTINIVEKNPSKFKVDNRELCERRSFIETTKHEVKVMKGKMNLNKNKDNDGTAREPLLGEESPMHFGNGWSSTPKYSKYSKLASQTDSPHRFHTFDHDLYTMHEKIYLKQDDELDVISDSVGSLKTVSKHIGIELDEQAVMLDDLSTELENADSKLDSTLKKVAKVLHMNNDRRQWLAIGILIGLLGILIILFVIL